MINTQCVFCKIEIEIGEDDFRFCDDCLYKLELIKVDLNKAEAILKVIKG